MELDVRVVAATNRDLEEMVNEGLFRADLIASMSFICQSANSCSEEDIPPLVEHF